MIIDKIILSSQQPSRIDIAWAKPFPKGFALYLYYNGKWQPQLLVNDKDNYNPEDDIPIEIHGGQIGPDSVGTDEIIDNSVRIQDLNEEVRDRLESTYEEGDESLYIEGSKPE